MLCVHGRKREAAIFNFQSYLEAADSYRSFVFLWRAKKLFFSLVTTDLCLKKKMYIFAFLSSKKYMVQTSNLP